MMFLKVKKSLFRLKTFQNLSEITVVVLPYFQHKIHIFLLLIQILKFKTQHSVHVTYVRYIKLCFQVRNLLTGFINTVKKVIKKRQEDIETTVLWLSNTLRLLNNLKQYSGEKSFKVCTYNNPWAANLYDMGTQ